MLRTAQEYAPKCNAMQHNVPRRTSLHRIALHRTALVRTAPHRTALHWYAPHHTAPHCRLLPCPDNMLQRLQATRPPAYLLENGPMQLSFVTSNTIETDFKLICDQLGMPVQLDE